MVVTFQFLVCPYYSSSASASWPFKASMLLSHPEQGFVDWSLPCFSCYNSRRSNEKNQLNRKPVCFCFFFLVLGDKIPLTLARWWFQTFFLFSPLLGEDSQFDSYFSKGLVQPPTSWFTGTLNIVTHPQLW